MEYFLVVPLAYLYFRLDERGKPLAVLRDPTFVPAAAAALGIGFVMTGMAHLGYPDFYSATLPAWIPETVWVSWGSGWLLLAAGAAMLQPAARRIAQWGILLLLTALLPQSLEFASLFEFGGVWSEFPWAWSRLVCHVGWLGWTMWCILPPDAEEPAPILAPQVHSRPAAAWR